MATTKKAAKLLDEAIAQAYYKIAQGQQISILDIPKVFALARKNVAELPQDDRGTFAQHEAINQAVRAAVLMFCQEAH